MTSRTMLGLAAPVAIAMLAGGLLGLRVTVGFGQPPSGAAAAPRSQEPGRNAPDAEAAPDSDDTANLTDLEKAIRAFEEQFVRDYNKGDSKAIAAHFTDDAEVVDIEGELYKGRDVIEEGFADLFAENKGAKISLEIFSVRSLSPDVAQEEGRSVMTLPEGASQSRLYTILYVKRDGRWMVSSVRDAADPQVSPHERLKDLEWMIGDWIDEREQAVVQFHCRWSEDENFLLRSATVHHRGELVLSVSQRIGWDPLTRKIRSWEFDSEGGFGEGRWTRDGERWIVKHTGVDAGGKTASSTNILTRERPDFVRWASTDRVIGDDVPSDDLTFALVRVPPKPDVPASDQPASPSTSEKRSAR